MSPVTTRQMWSSLLSLLELTTSVVVAVVVVNLGQVGSWSGRGCCELTQNARCRRVCLQVSVHVVCISILCLWYRLCVLVNTSMHP